MAEITLKGNPCNTTGDLPSADATAPGFTLVAGDLSEKTMADFQGKNIILNIVPSFDTGTCALSVKTFNSKAGQLEDTVVVNISKDLPFAQSRFYTAEGVETLRTYQRSGAVNSKVIMELDLSTGHSRVCSLAQSL